MEARAGMDSLLGPRKGLGQTVGAVCCIQPKYNQDCFSSCLRDPHCLQQGVWGADAPQDSTPVCVPLLSCLRKRLLLSGNCSSVLAVPREGQLRTEAGLRMMRATVSLLSSPWRSASGLTLFPWSPSEAQHCDWKVQ